MAQDVERRQFRGIALFGGPLIASIVGGLCLASGMSSAASLTAAVTCLCAVWWVTEPVPVPVTSLVPFAAFPLGGVLSEKQVATAYGHWLILLLLGGFMLSVAMERSGAHQRLAVTMVRWVGGGSGRRLVLGFMVATAACSMWISNTATTLMMLPVALAVLQGAPKLTSPLLLGIAYSASIGGMGTPVGTPPNVVLMGVYREVTGRELDFLRWMMIGLPVVAILLPAAWWWLTRRLTDSVAVELPRLPSWRPAETRVLGVFALTALAWVTRTAPFGGWTGALGLEGVGDSTVALAAVIALFLIPNGEGESLLTWERARTIPWGLLLLFGGGIAIARAFESSGLSGLLGEWLAHDLGIATWPVLAMIVVLCTVVTGLTEVTSNTATTTLLMPVLAGAAVSAGLEPLILMVPAALSASCAFMLPVATAPNAIVYGSGHVTTAQMARQGAVLNVIAVVICSIMCWLWMGYLFV